MLWRFAEKNVSWIMIECALHVFVRKLFDREDAINESFAQSVAFVFLSFMNCTILIFNRAENEDTSSRYCLPTHS